MDPAAARSRAAAEPDVLKAARGVGLRVGEEGDVVADVQVLGVEVREVQVRGHPLRQPVLEAEQKPEAANITGLRNGPAAPA